MQKIEEKKIHIKQITLCTALVMFSTFGTFAQNEKVESVYTKLDEKSCKTLESSIENSGWYRGECQGVGGYKLQITEGDIRQSIDVRAPNKRKYELNFTGNVSAAFSYVGAKAEWRVTRKGKMLVPIALIVRFDASENPEDATKTISYLVVSKITKKEICVTNVVKPGAKANEEARQLADIAKTKPCKKSEN
jgi:hypothetical protein